MYTSDLKMDFGERLRDLLSKKGIRATVLSEKMGKSRTLISAYLGGKSFPSHEFYTLLKAEIPSLNMNWLLFGEGSMFLSSEEHEEREIKEPPAEENRVLKLENELKAMRTQNEKILAALGQLGSLAAKPPANEKGRVTPRSFNWGVYRTGNILKYAAANMA